MLRTTVVATVRRSVAAPACRTRSVSQSANVLAPRFYSSGSSIHDNDPELLEAEKQKNLKGLQNDTSAPHKHAPGWNEYLATTSEAYTKADKSDAPINEIQSTTVEWVKKRHPPAGGDATETVVEKVSDMAEGMKEAALQAKDTILGPLASAGKGAVSSSEDHSHRGERAAKAKREGNDHTGSEAAVKADRGDL